MLCISATVSILDGTHMIRPHSTVLVFHMLQHGDLSPSFLWHRRHVTQNRARARGWMKEVETSAFTVTGVFLCPSDDF